MQPVVQSTNEKPEGPLELRVYPGSDCHGTLYQDDGLSFAYQKGNFLRVNFTCHLAPGSLTITSSIEKNAYQPWWNSTQLKIYRASAEPKEARIGDQVIHDWQYDAQTHCITLTVPDSLKNWNVRLSF